MRSYCYCKALKTWPRSLSAALEKWPFVKQEGCKPAILRGGALAFSVAEMDAYDFAYAGFLHGYSVD